MGTSSDCCSIKIANYAASNEAFLEFVEANGYQSEKYWCNEGGNGGVDKNLNTQFIGKKIQTKDGMQDGLINGIRLN